MVKTMCAGSAEHSSAVPRHSREGGNPSDAAAYGTLPRCVPAFAGMTKVAQDDMGTAAA